jgi:hypothetical protein
MYIGTAMNMNNLMKLPFMDGLKQMQVSPMTLNKLFSDLLLMMTPLLVMKQL